MTMRFTRIKIKELLLIFLLVVVFYGTDVMVNVNAATISESNVNEKLNTIVNQYSGKTSWPSSFGSECYSFAHFVFNTVFGRNTTVGSYSAGTEYKFNNPASDVIIVGTLAPGYSDNQLEQLLDKAKPGDYVQLKRRTGSAGPHSEIVLNVNPVDNAITILDANSGSVYNQIRTYTQNYFTDGSVKSFRNWNQAVTIYRYKDYITEQPPIGHLDTFSAGNGCINLGGWAYDPDNKEEAIELRIEVGSSIYSVKADQTVEGYNSEKDGHAIATSISIAERGEQNVKVWAIDITGDDNTLLDSKVLTINSDTAPIGAVDAIGGGEGVIGLSGWAHDSDTPGEQMTLRIEIVGGSSYTFTTGGIGSSGYPSFSERVAVKEVGTFQVNVYALDQGPYMSESKNVLLKTVSVTIRQKHLNSYIDTYTEKIAETVGCVTGLEGTLKIEGWVQDINGIEKVEYEILDVSQSSDGVKGICEHRNRDDVANAYPGYPTGNEGYYAYIPYKDLRYAFYYPENMKIILTAYCSAGEKHSLGEIEVKRSFPETTGPTVSDIQITDISYKGYTVKATVLDASGIDRVQFPTWTLKDGQDDIADDWGMNEVVSGSIVGNTVTYRVNISDHNNESGTYKTHIYAYDKYGNCISVPINDTRGELEIPARGNYTISYDANGGTGAPDVQTKLEGEGLILSSIKPSRSGYTFTGWKGKDKEYQPGDLYIGDHDDILYAIWKETEHKYIGTVTKLATCINTGIVTFECSICRNTYTEDIPATGHQHTELRNIKDATCIEEGYTGDTYCSDCDTKLSTGEAIAKKAHTWDEGVVTNAATCIEKGVKTYTCTSCKTTKTEDIPTTGHQHTELRNVKASSCTEEGYTGDIYCSDCEAKLSAGGTIAKKSHTWNEGVVTKAATCTEKGVKIYTCTSCKTTNTEDIPATGHQHTELRNVKASSCTEEGYTGDIYCSDCEAKLSAGGTIAKKSHTWNEGVVTKAATCTEKGVKIYTCTSCKTTNTEDIPATGHQHTELRNMKAATCTADGYTGDEYCSECKQIVVQGKVITKMGHSWNAGIVTKEPTCTEGGIKMYTCNNCQETKTEVVSTSGHIGPNTIKFTKSATCTVDGYTGDEYCQACGKMVKEGKIILATGHFWDSGKITTQPTASVNGIRTYTCPKCKATRTETVNATGLKIGATIKDTKSNGYYKVTDKKGLVSFVKPINTKKSSVTIPDTINYQGITCRVIAIENNAFKGNKYLAKLKIGNYVTTIGSSSFYGCVKLSGLTFGNNTVKIGNYAFAKCTALSKLTIPSKVTTIGKQAFYGCKKLKSITIKTKKLTTKTVGTNCFKGIYSKPTIAVSKTNYASYKKLLQMRGIGNKAVYKKI